MSAGSEAYDRGITAYTAGDYATAIAEFEFSIQTGEVEGTGLEDIYYNVAVCYLRLGQDEMADSHAANAPSRQADYDDMKAHILTGTADHVAAGDQAVAGADYRAAVTSYELALASRDFAELLRDDIYYKLAIAYMHLGEWGPAEEYAAAASGDHLVRYEAQKKQLLQMTGSQLLDDRSAVDETFARARALYDAGNYADAWAWLQEVDADEAVVAGVGEEITLYKALCALKLGNVDTADETASQLSSHWRETYDEARAATGTP